MGLTRYSYGPIRSILQDPPQVMTYRPYNPWRLVVSCPLFFTSSAGRSRAVMAPRVTKEAEARRLLNEPTPGIAHSYRIMWYAAMPNNKLGNMWETLWDDVGNQGVGLYNFTKLAMPLVADNSCIA